MKSLRATTLLTRTLLACVMVWMVFERQVFGAEVDHSSFDTILHDNVRDERVDYLNIRKNHWPQLIEYLDTLDNVNPLTLARNERLAFYINLYNASMIRAVTQRFRADYSPAASLYGVFKEKFVRMNHETISLDHLEHKIIRPTFKDPRVHAALVCAARSCPPILDRAYVADRLDKALDKKMHDFVNDSQRNQIETSIRTLHLSKIFDWYADDFGGKSKLNKYVSTYLTENVRDFRVKFQSYSWELNAVHPQQGRWVRITKGSSKVFAKPVGGEVIIKTEKNQVFEVLGEEDGRLLLDLPFDQSNGWIDKNHTQVY